MKLSLHYQPAAPASASPYRLVDDQEQEIAWANDFLDAQRVRQLSLRSLRAYGYDLLHFARWWLQDPPRNLIEMDESTLLDYVRHQLNEDPKPTPQTINHRLGVLRSLYASIPGVRCLQARPSSSVPTGLDHRSVTAAPVTS
jgi:site-specific recombinase XerD